MRRYTCIAVIVKLGLMMRPIIHLLLQGRLPRHLALLSKFRYAEALQEALESRRFEVRSQCRLVSWLKQAVYNCMQSDIMV